jgi:AraC-like DNA-binding protein/mannose-6-phosphate isomerase-like protein (cupin superfamily)
MSMAANQRKSEVIRKRIGVEMGPSKKSSGSSTSTEEPAIGLRRRSTTRRQTPGKRSIRVPRTSCENEYRLVEPQINAEGVHVWPFNESFPIDVFFLTSDGRHNVRMNRHDYFEILCVCAGTARYHIQDRLLPLHEGDLAIIGSTVYHRLEYHAGSAPTMAALFFEPDIIRCDGGPDNAEYLTPFLLQDSQFPHVIPAKTGVPGQVFDLMRRIRAELPAMSTRSRLAVKTYLKMILILLVNQYSSYAGTVETFQRQQRALDRLRPLFNYLSQHFGESVQVRDAARTCGMSESHFMSFFKHATGQSFIAYLNHCRIERAEELLATSDKSMSELSQDMGFCDQSYFGTVFRRLVGMTPAAYRRRFRKSDESRFKPANHALPARSPGRVEQVAQASGRAKLTRPSATAVPSPSTPSLGRSPFSSLDSR